jgi:hypothetical protein
MTERPRPSEVLLPGIAVLATAILPLAYRGRLPDPMATHWGVDGLPDGHLPQLADHLLLLLVVLLVAAVPLWAAARADHLIARSFVATANALSALFLVLRWWTLEANADAVVWTDAAQLTFGEGLVVMVGVAVGGAFGWWAARGRPDRPVASERVVPTPVAAGEQLVWVGRQQGGRGPIVVVLVALLVVVLVTVLPVAAPAPAQALSAAVLAVVAAVLLTFTSIRAVIGPSGLTVRFGPLGLPRLHVPAEDIVEVRVEQVEPLAYGGWGYRMLPGVRAVVIRRGEGIRVVRRHAPDLVVTIDAAQAAAGALAVQIDRPGLA